jgi:hypothetical protein
MELGKKQKKNPSWTSPIAPYTVTKTIADEVDSKKRPVA